jgi:hypothetical protein
MPILIAQASAIVDITRFILFIGSSLFVIRRMANKNRQGLWRLEFSYNLHKIARLIRYIRRTPTIVGVFSSFSDVCKKGS